MGLFHFLDLSSVSAAEHNVSFDLTICAPSSRRVPVYHHPLTNCKRVSIPLEIILNILEAAYYDDNHLTSNDQLLRSCSLVCRHWSTPAQKLLFRRVTLRDQIAFSAFRNAVDRSTERGRMLGDAVVRLRVVLDHNQPLGISERDFARAVTLCPHLYELSLALYGDENVNDINDDNNDESRIHRFAPVFSQHTLALLRSGPRITAFEFSNWTENRQALVQLLQVWPTVQYLAMSGLAPQVVPSIPSTEELERPTAVFFPSALRELRMNFQTSPSVETIKWLLHRSVETLRVLEIEREPSGELLEYLVDAHGATLHALALPVCGSHEHALAVQQCVGLRELRVEGAWVSPMVYRKMPAGIQHVALGLDADTALQPVLELVKGERKRKSQLRAVTVQVWEGGDMHPQLGPLKMACAYRGVELKLAYDVRAFRELVRGDPVEATSFPRFKCLDNLRRMRFGG